MKRIGIVILVLLLAAAFAAPVSPARASAVSAAEATAGTDGYALKYMEDFFKDGANKQRLTGTPGADSAAQWIAAEFEKLGLEDPVVKTYEADKAYIKSFEIETASSIFQLQTDSKTAYNAAALFRGKQRAKTIVIGANYDNLYGQQYLQGYTNKSEGALDNASGVCAMLAIAKAVSENAEKEIRPEFNMLFVAFGANNDGLWGSYDFVQNSGGYGLNLSDISLMVNLSCIAGGDSLYLYCDEVDTLHQGHIKTVADSQNNFYALNLPPKNKKIILDAASPLQYTHKGLKGDHYYFWQSSINVAYFFGYNWDISALGNTESAGGSIAGTENDSAERLFKEFYADGAKMADSAVSIVTAVIYDENTSGVLSASQNEKYDYSAFLTNSLYPFIFQAVAITLLCALFALLYFNGKKNTPGMIMRKYTTRVAVFGDEYESEDK